MCLLGLKFFCKWADISDSEDCIFRRISSSPGNFHLFSHVTETVNLYYYLYYYIYIYTSCERGSGPRYVK